MISLEDAGWWLRRGSDSCPPGGAADKFLISKGSAVKRSVPTPPPSCLHPNPPPLLCFNYHILLQRCLVTIFSQGPHRLAVRRHLAALDLLRVPHQRPQQHSCVGKGNSNSHGTRPVQLIITMIKWIRTSRLSMKYSLSLCPKC